MLPLQLLISSFIALTAAKCTCGFATIEEPEQVYTDYLETDFTRTTLAGWRPQEYSVTHEEARGPFGKHASLDNVVVSNRGLQLWVRPSVDEIVPMAEVDTERTDMLYGTFRIRAKMSSVNGTCGAFFWVCSFPISTIKVFFQC
jgi:hypothetical protein